MTETTRRALLALIIVSVLGGLAAAVGLFAAWQVYVSPWRELPREEAAIVADWERARAFMPKDLRRGVVRTEVVGWLEAAAAEGAEGEALEPLAAWIETDGSLGTPGCTMVESLGPNPPDVLTFQLLRAGKNLAAAGMADHTALLARELRRRELVDLMVGQALATEAHALQPLGDLRPKAGELFGVLAREAACTDLLLAGMLDGSLKNFEAVPPSPFLSLEVERLRLQDFYGRLLLELDPVRDDPVAAAAVLARFDVPYESSLVAGMLVQGIPRIGGDYLRLVGEFGP